MDRIKLLVEILY